MKLCLVFDASAAVHYYLHEEQFQDSLAYLLSLKEKKEAIFILPVFCVTEVLNTLAKHSVRWNQVEPDLYKKMRESFLNDVRDRKTFYCYYFNRYHNFNAENVITVEHTTNTEFQAIGKSPKGNTISEKQKSLDSITQELKDKKYSLGKFYLNSFDILIIAMAMELKHFFGEKRLFIVTKDERLNTICKAGKNFPKVIYLPTDKTDTIKERFKEL